MESAGPFNRSSPVDVRACVCTRARVSGRVGCWLRRFWPQSAEAVLATEFQRLGGVRGRGRVGAVCRRWPRMRSMTCGAVTNATMRIRSPQRGQGVARQPRWTHAAFPSPGTPWSRNSAAGRRRRTSGISPLGPAPPVTRHPAPRSPIGFAAWREKSVWNLHHMLRGGAKDAPGSNARGGVSASSGESLPGVRLWETAG